MSTNPLLRLTPADLKALDLYKYSGKDYSLCSKYFMQRYWSCVVECLPKTLAPNMVTLLGFAASTSTSVLLLVLSFLSDEEYPNWVFAYAAVSLFVYQTLDAIDGKQARRTGCGSPLGELFDHGCDALFTPLMCCTTCLALGFTHAESFTYCFLICTGLFLSLFEQFCTGTLDLGYINGPVEGILMACVTYLWSAVVGPQWWATEFATPVFDTGYSILGSRLALRKPNDVAMLIGFAGGFTTMATNLLHAFTQPVSHAKVSRWKALLPQTLISTVVVYLALSSPALLDGPFPFAIELAYGFLISYTVTRMTVARLCRKSFKPMSLPYTVTVLLLILVLGIKLLSQPSEENTNVVSTVSSIFAVSSLVTVAAYLFMIVGVFHQFAGYLKINILTMTPEQRARNI